MIPNGYLLYRLVTSILGDERTGYILRSLAIEPRLLTVSDALNRAQIATALNAVLFSELLERVPTADEYVARSVGAGRTVSFDHGALRTIDGSTGDGFSSGGPPGIAAFARILEPLGYAQVGTYPLPKLHMTGHAFAHRDFAESVPQFFVSELHVAQLPEAARLAARRVFGNSVDPLGEAEHAALGLLARDGHCPLELAMAALPGLVRAFGRHHAPPALADYEILLAHSPEAAWIATEGQAFNHATDRVADVAALAAELLERGMPLKPKIEVSANGRVRQTAFLAAKVRRQFRVGDGSLIEREVPGSFFEFISRDVDPATGRIDLSFDSGNATGIFAVTSAQ
ncbi:MAG: DUF1338 family protein [Novosphingobium sp.]